MLFLLFHLGKDRYALETTRVAEVLPLLRLKTIPLAPRGVAGICNYRGSPVPVLDLCELALGRPAEPRLSTRLIMARAGGGADSERLVGLLAERATTTLRREPSDFIDTGVASSEAPYFGGVATDELGIIQRIRLDALLRPDMHAALLAAPVIS